MKNLLSRFLMSLVLRHLMFSVMVSESAAKGAESNADNEYLAPVPKYFPNHICDASWALAATSALSDRFKRLRKGESPDIILSPQFLLSCDDSNKGCKGGDPLSAYSFIYKEGIVEESLIAYQGKGRDSGFSCSSLNTTSNSIPDTYRQYHISKYGRISGVTEMESALNHGSFVCKILATQEFIEHKTGIFNQQMPDKSSHYPQFVSIVGHSKEQNVEYWIGRTFSGKSSGNEIFKIAKNKNILAIESECFYADPSSQVSVISSKNNQSVRNEEIGKNASIRSDLKDEENIEIPVHPFIQEKAKLKPKFRYLMVFGPSQYGKSTFVNTLLEKAGQKSQKATVGKGIGNSTTLNVTIYKVGSIPEMFPDDRVDYDCIYIIDVPGIYDSNFYYTDEEIFKIIKSELINYNLDFLDAILIFESMKDDSRKIKLTAHTAFNVFGPSFYDSSLVLSTKWNTVEPDQLNATEIYLESLLCANGLQSMKWHNNYNDKRIISEQDMNRQFSELGKRILGLKPYKIKGMDLVLQKINERAEQIRQNDPDRFALVEETIDIQVPEEYIEDIEMDTIELVKLNEDEINQRAEELWAFQPIIPGGMIPDPSGKRNILKRAIKIPEVETQYITIKTGMIFKDRHTIPTQILHWKDGEEEIDIGPMLVQDEGKKLPKEFFVNILRNEVKTVQAKKTIPIKKIRMKDGTKVIKINQERYDFEHYRKLAIVEYNKGFFDERRSEEL